MPVIEVSLPSVASAGMLVAGAARNVSAPVLLLAHGWSLWSVPATPITSASPAG